MTESELASFYKHAYRQTYQGSEEPLSEDFSIQKGRARVVSRFLRESSIGPVQSHLDIGCSVGILLEEIREAYSCEAVGIEPGEAHRAHALERGLRVFSTLEMIETSGGRTFDLISMLHVLEHLPDPVDYLRDLKDRFLSTNGWLLIEVPNLYAHDCFETAHLSAFSELTLRGALETAGYSLIRIRRHGEPRSRLLPLYLTVLAQPEGQAGKIWAKKPTREQGVVLKRRTGMIHRRILERIFPRQAWLPV
jgi:SAM-dependent methyltransferase